MHFSKKAAVAAFVSTAHAANFNVQVGQGGALTFQPQTVNAAVGDTVTFQFAALNHTVTSGNANTGCAPDGTFNSGFIPIPTAGANAQGGNGGANGNAAAAKGKRGKNNRIRGLNNIFEERSLEARQQGGPYNFVVTVRNTDPQVFYCAQLTHCQMGMVGVINPSANGATSLATYQALSAKAQVNQLPNTAAGTGGRLNAAAKGVLGKQAATPPAGPNNAGQRLNGGNTGGNNNNQAANNNRGKGGNRGAAAANGGANGQATTTAAQGRGAAAATGAAQNGRKGAKAAAGGRGKGNANRN